MATVLQVVILRDGLLVGTEVFLPGAVAVGSDGDLALEGLAPRHARFVLRDGKVRVEALGGDVSVNGNPVSVTPVRPVDDVLVGPYSLKLRVIGQRAPKVVADGPTVVIPPAPRRVAAAQRLFLELAWGNQRLDARAFGRLPKEKPLIAAADDRAAMPLWGFGVDAPMVLAAEHDGGYRVFVPASAAVERRDASGDFQPVRAAGHVDLKLGDAVRFTSERTALVARVGPAEAAPFVSPLKGAPVVALALTAMLLALFGAFVSFAPTEDEADFVLKAMPRAEVKALFEAPKKKQPKVDPVAVRDVGRPPAGQVAAERVHRPPRVRRERQVLPFGGQMISEVLAVKLPDVKLPMVPGRRVAVIHGPRLPVTAVPPGFSLDGGTTRRFDGLANLRREGVGDMSTRAIGGLGVLAQPVGTGPRRRPNPDGEGIDKNGVRKVIDAHVHVISGCYERAMIAEKDSGGGKLTLEWGISTAGTVTHVRTKHSSMKTAAVERCIIAALKTWQFPKARRAGVIISYPFLFNSLGY